MTWIYSPEEKTERRVFQVISSTDTNVTQKCLDMALIKTNIKT